MQHKLLLTFDVEDFINDRSLMAFRVVLDLLAKYELKALFFITGHMAEKITGFPRILQLLGTHEIGFHSSAHSVHPTIFEYCDVENYEEAYHMTLERETAHINPLSGEIEEKGGICALKKIFSSKEILAYRAPGYCCPPPHLEAMRALGIKYDFSWSISSTPVRHKGVTFYPFPILLECEVLLGEKSETTSWARLSKSILMSKVTVLNFHVDQLVNKTWWDGIYHECNPSELRTVPSKDDEQTANMLRKMEFLLKAMKLLEKSRTVNTSPHLTEGETELDLATVDVGKMFGMHCFWPKTFFDYTPKHAYSQFSRFFD